MTDYKANIQKLRAGTALSSAEFIETIKARQQAEFDIEVGFNADNLVVIHVNHHTLGELSYQKDETLSPAMAAAFQNAKNNNFEDFAQEAESTTTYSPAVHHAFKEEALEQFANFQENEAIQEQFASELEYDNVVKITSEIIEHSEGNKPISQRLEFRHKTVSFVVHETEQDSMSSRLCENTGWNTTDMKWKDGRDSQVAIGTADHETGHAVLFHHLNRGDAIDKHPNDEYNDYIHESFADYFESLCAIHDGEDLDVFDKISITRTYAAIVPYREEDFEPNKDEPDRDRFDGDYEHFTSPTLNHLKGKTDVEHIQSLENKSAVANYALTTFLGKEGHEPAYLSEEAFIETKEQMRSVAHFIDEHCTQQRDEEGKVAEQPVPTPLQFKAILMQNADVFTPEQQDFIEQYVAVHSETLVHIDDVHRGLLTQARFDNPEVLCQSNTKMGFLHAHPARDAYEQQLQSELFPTNEDGEIVELETDEQLFIIEKESRFISKGGLLDDGIDPNQALETLNYYKDAFIHIQDMEIEQGYLNAQERAQEVITRDDEFLY